MPKLARRLLISKLPLEHDEGVRLLTEHILAGMRNYEITAPPIAMERGIGGHG